MGGCLAAACHGAPAKDTLAGRIDENTWQSSGACWVAADPHTAAYSLLTEKPNRPVKVTAQHIMERYAPGTRATEDARCVACHTNPALAAPERFADPHARALRNEGVGCEACHGSAGGWLHPHTSWTGNRREEYAKTGMTPLFDLGERALTCLGCHVGAPEDKARGLPVRDMNHDMIAAGHPRLNFDFAEYLRRLPAHWQEKNREPEDGKPVARPLNPAKAWLVGRAAHAEAACKLLASRVDRAAGGDGRTPWPEFAEYNCASCHHDLRADPDTDAQWRKDPQWLDGRPLGVPAWQTVWPMTPAAGMPAPRRADSLLKSVLEVMEVRRSPDIAKASAGVSPHPLRIRPEVSRSADAERLTAAANRSIGDLGAKRSELMKLADKQAVDQARTFLLPATPQVPEWDSAAQLYFGLAALERANGSRPKVLPKFRTGLEAFRANDWSGAAQALEAIRAAQK
jgi:hypothetical protein